MTTSARHADAWYRERAASMRRAAKLADETEGHEDEALVLNESARLFEQEALALKAEPFALGGTNGWAWIEGDRSVPSNPGHAHKPDHLAARLRATASKVEGAAPVTKPPCACADIRWLISAWYCTNCMKRHDLPKPARRTGETP